MELTHYKRSSDRSDAETPFQRKLARTMEVRGFSRAALANKIEVDRATVGRWLTGESAPSDPITKQNLEDALDVIGLFTSDEEVYFETNRLFNRYTGMEYFPIFSDNLDSYGLFEKKLEGCLDGTKRSMHYTALCEFDDAEDGSLEASLAYRPHELNYASFLERLLRNEIIWEKVEIFYSTRQLLRALCLLRLLRGTKFLLKFFPTPPKSFPVINVESFDHKTFMLGGYNPERMYDPNCVLLGDREPLRQFLINYWSTVWLVGGAKPLTPKDADAIAQALGETSPSEWEDYKQAVAKIPSLRE